MIADALLELLEHLHCGMLSVPKLQSRVRCRSTKLWQTPANDTAVGLDCRKCTGSRLVKSKRSKRNCLKLADQDSLAAELASRHKHAKGNFVRCTLSNHALHGVATARDIF